MMGKHTYKFFWGLTLNIEKLEKSMNDLSAKGMHIVKSGWFWNKVVTDPSQQYVYQIDFQRELNTKRKKKEYTDLYTEGGWEYIGSAGPLWHYFRKSLSAGEPYKLYTDHPSLIDYYRRIRNVIAVVTCFNIVIVWMNMIDNYEFTSFRFAITCVQVFTTILLVCSLVGLIRRLNKLQRERN
jgi:hypothetical protein